MAEEAEKEYADEFSYDTDSVREQDRLSYWSEFVSDRIMGVSMQAPATQSFSGKIQVYSYGGFSMSFSKADACSAISAPIGGRVAGAGQARTGWWVVCHRRRGRIAQGRTDSPFRPKDVLLIDCNRPYRREQSNVVASSIFLPRAAIADAYVLQQLDDMAACKVEARRAGWSSLLSGILSSMTPELARVLGADQIERQLFLDHLHSVLLLALRETKGRDLTSRIACANASKLAQRQLFLRMQHWLRENFWRPNLTAQYLATEFGVSTRYIHQLYADHLEQGSFLGTLRSLRLAEAMRMLGSPEFCSWSVARIGVRCGFGNPAYFGLIFRRWFGCAPTAARTRLLEQAAAGKRVVIPGSEDLP